MADLLNALNNNANILTNNESTTVNNTLNEFINDIQQSGNIADTFKQQIQDIKNLVNDIRIPQK